MKKSNPNLMIISGILIVVVVIGFIYFTKPSETEQAKTECIKICMAALQAGTNLTNGPCISNKIINNWACDVAHNPRQNVDNLPENQCSAYPKQVSHFVEVEPNCNFIRAV